MRKGFALALCLFAATPVWADPASATMPMKPILNRIRLQLHAEQWLATKTALVNVVVNAAVTDQGIEKIQASVMQKLAELSGKGEWHILSFDRQQDKSGLESLQITAQARLAQEELTALRNKAKSISIPGETFTIDSIQFTPSEDEILQANTALRGNLYQQAKNEIDTLNKIYPDQKYFLHDITFRSQPIIEPMAENMTYAAKAVRPMAMPASQALTVGNKSELFANVVISSVHDTI